MPSQLTLKDAAPQYPEHLRAAWKNEHTVGIYGRALWAVAGSSEQPQAGN